MFSDPDRLAVRPWLPRLALLAVMAAAVACGDGGERFPAPSPIDTGEGGRMSIGGGPRPPQPCTDGDTRDCKVVLGVQGSVVSCFYGVQECVDGKWGDCVDPGAEPPPESP